MKKNIANNSMTNNCEIINQISIWYLSDELEHYGIVIRTVYASIVIDNMQKPHKQMNDMVDGLSHISQSQLTTAQRIRRINYSPRKIRENVVNSQTQQKYILGFSLIEYEYYLFS